MVDKKISQLPVRTTLQNTDETIVVAGGVNYRASIATFMGGAESLQGQQTVTTDEDFTLAPGASPQYTLHTGTLTADREVTLNPSGAVAGHTFRITRVGMGSFALNVEGLATLTSGEWATFTYDGATYYLSSFGSLSATAMAPPTLVAFNVVIASETSVDLTVTTDGDDGAIYWVVVIDGAPVPNAVQIKLGTDGSGNPAAASGSIAVTAVGVKTDTATDLADDTSYDAYAVHYNATLSASNVVSDSVTTPALPVGGDAVLGVDEPDGLGVDFLYADDSQRVAVRTAGVLATAALEPFFTTTATSPKMVYDASGVLIWSPHNMFLNSETPATQNVGNLLANATYTIKVTGSGSITVTSAGSGVATDGSPLTFIASGITAVCTVSGTLTRIQMNRGRLPTEYVATTGTAKYKIVLGYQGSSLGLITETTATNVCLWSRDLTDAVWVKSNVTATKNQVGADGQANAATRIAATAANATVLQTVTLASQVRKFSALVKRLTGSGVVEMTQDGGATWAAVIVPSGVYRRVEIPGATLANPVMGFRLTTNGDAIAVDFCQNEVGLVATSPWPAYAVNTVRNPDTISCPTSQFPFAQDFTVILTAAPRGGIGGSFAALSDNTTSNRYVIDNQSGARLARLFAQSGGVTQVDTGIIATPVANQFYNFGAGIEADNFAIVVDGAIVTDMSGLLATVNKLWVGGAHGGGSGYLRRIKVVPRRMTNAEIVAATTPAVVLYPKTEVVITQTPDNFFIYTSGDNPETSRYIRHQFQRYTVSGDGPGDGWDWERIHEVTRTGDSSFAINHNLTDVGQHWPALKEDGKGFVGGSTHGYEFMDSIVLKADGVTKPLDGATPHRCNSSAEIFYNSIIYDRDNPATPIFNCAKHMTFTASGITNIVTIQTLKALNIKTFYTHMLSFSKDLDGIPANGRCVDEFYAAPGFVEGVVGTEGAPLDTHLLLMLGSASGIRAEVEITGGWTHANKSCFIQHATGSEKIYFSPLGINNSPTLAVASGTTYTTTGVYRITTHN